MFPAEGGPKILNPKSFGAEGAEAKFWLSASNIGRGGGGTTPPMVYGRSNASLGTRYYAQEHSASLYQTESEVGLSGQFGPYQCETPVGSSQGTPD